MTFSSGQTLTAADLNAALANYVPIAALAASAAGEGGSLVGLSSGDTLQTFVTKLMGTNGAGIIGAADGGSVQAFVNTLLSSSGAATIGYGGSTVASAIAYAAMGNLVSVAYATRDEIDADLAHDDGAVGLVYADATDANNDLYVKSGASGSGGWTLTAAIHGIIAGLAQPFVNSASVAMQRYSDAIEYADTYNLFTDYAMTGTTVSGWASGSAMPGTSPDGRATLTFDGIGDTHAVSFAGYGLATDDKFTIAITLESTPGTATAKGHAQQYTGGTTYVNDQIFADTDAATTGPLQYVYEGTVNASATFLKFFFQNCAISQIRLFKGKSGAPRRSFVEAPETRDQMLAVRSAQRNQYARPNVWPDVDMTGAVGTTTLGWQSALTPGTYQGRDILTAPSGSVSQMRIPVALLGGPGATISASVEVNAASGAGSQSAVSISQVRSNNTTISSAPLSAVSQVANTVSGSHQRTASGIVLDGSCAYVALNFGTATASVTFSVPSIHQGSDPAWRAPRPALEDLMLYAVPLLAGPTSSRPLNAPAGWRYYDTDLGYSVVSDGVGGWTQETSIAQVLYDYYVDGTPGSNIASDYNDGKSEDTPFATLTAAITAVGSNTNKSIGIKRGSVLRNQPVTLSAAGTIIGEYGDASLPRAAMLGSTESLVSGFTKIGNLYSAAQTFDPITLALVAADGAITKLWMTSTSGTNSAADPTTEGMWTWFPATHATKPNTLEFYTTADLTGASVEIPQGGTTTQNNCITMHGDGCKISNIDCRFWNGGGIWWDGPNITVDLCNSDYNGQDGFDQHPGALNFTLRGDGLGPNAVAGRAWFNGRYRAGGSGPGDGTSAHAATGGYAAGSIMAMSFKGNTQTGIGNQSGSDVSSYGCYLEDNYYSIFIYADASGRDGTHIHDYAIINLKGAITQNMPWQFYGSNAPDGTMMGVMAKLRNATVYYAAGVTNPTNGARIAGYTNEWDNLIAVAANSASNVFYMPTGNVMTERNCSFYGFGAVANGSGINPTNTNRLTTDPQLIAPATGNFGIKSTSPAKASGYALGLTTDYFGHTVPSTPDRGAVQRL